MASLYCALNRKSNAQLCVSGILHFRQTFDPHLHSMRTWDLRLQNWHLVSIISFGLELNPLTLSPSRFHF